MYLFKLFKLPSFLHIVFEIIFIMPVLKLDYFVWLNYALFEYISITISEIMKSFIMSTIA